MTTTRKTRWTTEDGFDLLFEPVEGTVDMKETPGGYEVRYLTPDQDPQSPGDEGDDNLFLVHYHRDFHVTREKVTVEDDARNWYQGKKISQAKDYWIFPVAAYIHSGVVLSLGDGGHFPDQRWDVSHVGLVFVAKKEWKTRDKAHEAASGLVKTWNTYLSGDVYGIVLEKFDKKKNQVDHDSVWGYGELQYAKEALKTDL